MSSALNLARFDLISIRLAVACAHHGSLTGAARDNHLALAAASRRLRELEEALGSALFERHAKGLSTTPAGRVFVKHGLALLQTMEQLSAELNDLRQGITRHIRLCASTAAINQFLPRLLAEFGALQPQIQVELEEQVSEQVVSTLREGRAELGVFVEGPDTTGLHTHLFRHDELVVLLPRHHPVALRTQARQALSFASLLDEPWISLASGAALLQKQQQAALSAGKPLRLRMQVRSFDAVCHMVASGLGLAVLPKAATLPMARAMKLAWRPLNDAWAQRRLLLALVDGVADPGLASLVEHLIPGDRPG
jgi:DNA-binding transcriptional LysR family regulator